MCTAAWRFFPEGYELVFNRDELWTRQPSVTPSVETDSAITGICSRDPDGGGTWLFTNQHGLTIALLNAYPDGSVPPRGKRSRGDIPLLAKKIGTVYELNAHLKHMDLRDYAPFHLIALSLSGEQSFYWNGRSLIDSRTTSNRFLTTSSVDPEAVRRARAVRYDALCGHTIEDRLKDTQAGAPPEALFVTRDDGGTVSTTTILVTSNEVHFSFVKRGEPSIRMFIERISPASVP